MGRNGEEGKEELVLTINNKKVSFLINSSPYIWQTENTTKMILFDSSLYHTKDQISSMMFTQMKDSSQAIFEKFETKFQN